MSPSLTALAQAPAPTVHALAGLDRHDAQQMVQEFWEGIHAQQFEVVYQPQMDAQSGRLAGFEALVRWNHPIRGQLTPGAFLPILDRFRLTAQLDRWMLDRVMQQRLTWELAGHRPPRIAVNMSPQTLHSDRILEDVQACLFHNGQDVRALELEVTEVAGLDAVCQQTLQSLSQLGVAVAIDDFGAGYAALGTLAHTVASRLKLDRSLVAGVHRNARQAIVVRGVLAVAEQLGLRVTAEGIEGEDQLLWCRSQGIQSLQGYYIGRPMTAAAAQRWLP